MVIPELATLIDITFRITSCPGHNVNLWESGRMGVYNADEATKRRKLAAAQAAGDSAVGNGCSPDEARAAFERGIARALGLAPAAPRALVAVADLPVESSDGSSTPALDRFEQRWSRAA